MKRIKKKYLISALIMILAFGFLLYSLISDSLTYYYTTSEIIEEGESVYGKDIRISGSIVTDSIKWDPSKPELNFIITDEHAVLPVIYAKEMPHTFDEDKEVIIRGEYKSDGVFYADEIMMKCASKYEPED